MSRITKGATRGQIKKWSEKSTQARADVVLRTQGRHTVEPMVEYNPAPGSD